MKVIQADIASVIPYARNPEGTREFSLPWPDGESVGKGPMMVEAWRKAIAL